MSSSAILKGTKTITMSMTSFQEPICRWPFINVATRTLTPGSVGDILVEQHDRLSKEQELLCDVSKRLKQSVATVHTALDIAKKKRDEAIVAQEKRVRQLESLNSLVRQKEEQVS